MKEKERVNAENAKAAETENPLKGLNKNKQPHGALGCAGHRRGVLGSGFPGNSSGLMLSFLWSRA